MPKWLQIDQKFLIKYGYDIDGHVQVIVDMKEDSIDDKDKPNNFAWEKPYFHI